MMPISVGRTLIIIAICAVCTFFERLLPFVVFRGREVPSVVRYLGKILPTAVIATLLIYCLRGVTFSAPADFLPSLIAVGVTAALHLWKGNTFLSIVGGTACYVILVRFIFI